MLGRGSVDRARPLSVAMITAGFPRGTAEGTNQLRKKRQLFVNFARQNTKK